MIEIRDARPQELKASPITTLPFELLSRTLCLSLPAEDWSVERLRQLAWVAKYWKEVVIRTPELWAVAKLPHPVNSSSWREDLRLALRMSRQVPLTVAYDGGYQPILPADAEVQLIDEFIEDVGRHVTRWQTVECRGVSAMKLIQLLGERTPALETLSIDFQHHLDTFGTPLVPTGPDHSPNGSLLRHLTMFNALPSWHALPRLQSLVLIHRHHRWTFLSLQQFLGLLRSSTELEWLHLEGVECLEDVLDEMAPVYLPRLEKLHLEGVGSTLSTTLLSAVQADSLACIDIISDTRFCIALGTGNPRHTVILQKVSSSLGLTITMSKDQLHVGTADGVMYMTFAYEEGDVRTEALDSFITLLVHNNIRVPIRLHIGSALDEYAAFEDRAIRFKPRVLEDLPMLVELRHHSRVNAGALFEYLSQPQRTRNGRVTWPCPSLREVWVDGGGEDGWEGLEYFLRRECTIGQGGYDGLLRPTALQKLVIVGNPPLDALGRIVGVEEVVMVDEWPEE